MDDKTTTMNTSLEAVLKQEILGDVLCEASASKVYSTIYGLNNLGRTYFCTYEEVVRKADEAETQMMQRYGAEIYGRNAQLRTQHVAKSGTGNSNMANTGTGSPVKEASDGPLSGSGGLIHCSVSKMKRLPNKFFEAAGDFKKLKESSDAFIQWLDRQPDEWKRNNQRDIQELKRHFGEFRPATGPSGKDNQDAWNGINEILKRRPWSDWLRTDRALKQRVDELRNGWVQFTGGDESAGGASATSGGASLSKEDREWDPAIPMRIDIQTNFDENWFKRKFKSGMLNALIMGLKTAARARTSVGGETEWTGHKYTADEMLPQDIRKLDGIQWKMTNKVTQDYIKYLLGWSREKKKVRSGTGFMPFSSELSSDPSFGQTMAKRALGGRGFMSRLRQKLFAGGQSNNVVSVAFQLADPNDGWKLVDEDGTPIEGTDGTSGTDGTGGTDGTDGTEGREGREGGGGSGGGDSSGGGGSSETTSPSDTEFTDEEMEKIKTLLQRVIELEKAVWGKERGKSSEVSESTENDEQMRLTDDILMAYLEDSI